MSTTWLDFKQLRRDVSIADVLRHYGVSMRFTGAQGSGFCPLPTHDAGKPSRPTGHKRSPSFSVNITKNVWQCFGCGASGNVLDLACRLEGLDPGDGGNIRKVAVMLAETFRVTHNDVEGEQTRNRSQRRSPPSREASSPQPRRRSRVRSGSTRTHQNGTRRDVPLFTPATNEEGQAVEQPVLSEVVGGNHPSGVGDVGKHTAPRVVINGKLDFALKQLDVEHPYLASRGLTCATIETFGLGVASRGLMQGRAAIPIHDGRGDLVAYAGRIVDDARIDESHPRYLFPAPRERDGVRHEFRKSLLLYNLHRLQCPLDHLVLVEGFTGVWWLHEHGYPKVVALMGSSGSDEQLALIVQATKPDGTVWLMPDGDDAGERCAHDLLVRLSPLRTVRWLKLGAGGQPTDLDQNELDAIFDAGKHPERH